MSLALLGMLALSACGESTVEVSRLPLLVVGVDGLDGAILEALWRRGRLPNLKGIAERGTFGPLATSYGLSPIIWTTVATGVEPTEHGITDFVASTPAGDIPVSSSLRKRPALWEMLDRVGRSTAVLGWWATWPAETVDGLLLSDRAAIGLERSIWPAEREPELEEWRRQATARPFELGIRPTIELQDRLVTLASKQALLEGHDLVLAYFRLPDIISHAHLEEFDYKSETSPDDDPVALAYQAIDRTIGDLMAVAPPRTRLLVVSDHGFFRPRRPRFDVVIDFNLLLAEFGFTQRSANGMIDLERSSLWTNDTIGFSQRKRIHLRAGTGLAEAAEVESRLRSALARCTYRSGAPVFDLVEPKASELSAGARFVVAVRTQDSGDEIRIDGEPVEGAVFEWGKRSGLHGSNTHGVVFALGEGFAKGADTSAASVRVVAPTVLYALGLPVADDFAGPPATALFDEGFRARYPIREIRSWGRRRHGAAETSAADAAMVRELGALGYLQ